MGAENLPTDESGSAGLPAPSSPAETPHISVLLDEVVRGLEPLPGSRILDGTLGAGGHSRALLERAAPTGKLLGLDRDDSALALSRERLSGVTASRKELVHACFDEAPAVALRFPQDFAAFDAILLDLGVSSMQLDRPERGFGFSREGPLDMRMDPTQGMTAAEVVNEGEEEDLADLIFQLGEEKFSRRIAREIVRARKAKPISTTRELAEIVERVVPRIRKKKGPTIHPATRTFQALRIAVNEELSRLERALPALFQLLAPGGRFAVISFHSLEDRPVKQAFRGFVDEGRARALSKKPIIATDEEIARNPRSRSAKLRIIEKL